MLTESRQGDIGMQSEPGQQRGQKGESGLKICRICGNEFAVVSNVQRICSEECRRKSRLEKVTAHYNETHPIKPRNCLYCGKEFFTRERRKKYCSGVCRDQRFRIAQKKYDKNNPAESTCETCGIVFAHSAKSPRKHCTPECRQIAFKAKQAERAKPRKCKTCGTLFKASNMWTSHSFCSDACRPKQPAACPWCNGPMPEQRGLKVDKYCSHDCKRESLAERNRIKAKEKAEQNEKQRRADLCSALLLWRNGASLQTIEESLGWKNGTGSGKMLKSSIYRKLTNKRKFGSSWHEAECDFNARSKQFRLESDFRNHAVGILSERFEYVKPEVSIPGTRRKIDIVVKHGLHSFGIELKNGNRTARLDQTLGQALVKCAALNLIPVCAVPDDIRMDKVFLNGCKRTNAIAGTISQVVTQMMQTVAAHPIKVL